MTAQNFRFSEYMERLWVHGTSMKQTHPENWVMKQDIYLSTAGKYHSKQIELNVSSHPIQLLFSLVLRKLDTCLIEMGSSSSWLFVCRLLLENFQFRYSLAFYDNMIHER